jgi:hypothetical protein
MNAGPTGIIRPNVQRTRAPHERQVDHHDHHRDEGDGGRERQAAGAVLVDDVAEHLRASADDLNGDVVAEAQREREH